ncbi:MAG: hypothetical protein AAFX40_02090 [Cyanobacteria bacterium J06639_1]
MQIFQYNPGDRLKLQGSHSQAGESCFFVRQEWNQFRHRHVAVVEFEDGERCYVLEPGDVKRTRRAPVPEPKPVVVAPIPPEFDDPEPERLPDGRPPRPILRKKITVSPPFERERTV